MWLVLSDLQLRQSSICLEDGLLSASIIGSDSLPEVRSSWLQPCSDHSEPDFGLTF